MSAVMVEHPVCEQCGERHVPRRHYIGSGDAAAIIGVSDPKYRTAVGVYKSKVDPPPLVEREIEVGGVIERGILLEPVILDSFQRFKGVEIVDRQKFLQFPGAPFAIGSHIDGRLKVDGSIVEAKSAAYGLREQWGEAGSDDVPESYLVQGVHHLISAPDAPGVWYPVYFVGFTVKMEWFYVPRDNQFVKDVLDSEVAFAEKHIIPRVPPPAVTIDDVKRIFPKDRGTEVEVSIETALAVNDLARVRASLKRLDEEEKLIAGKVGTAFGENAIMTFGGKAIATFKTEAKNSFDAKSLRAAHPAIAALFERKGTTRVLRTKK